MHRHLTLLLALGAGLVVIQSRTAEAVTKIVGQPPCTSIGGRFCWGFDGPVGGTLVSNGFFTFTAPSQGTAIVSLVGSMVCTAAPSTTPRVVDILTAIVRTPVANATVLDYATPGVLRSATVLTPSTLGTAQTFNLGTSRVFKIPAAGTYGYTMLMTPLLVQSGTSCKAYSLEFAVVFAS